MVELDLVGSLANSIAKNVEKSKDVPQEIPYWNNQNRLRFKSCFSIHVPKKMVSQNSFHSRSLNRNETIKTKIVMQAGYIVTKPCNEGS